MKNLGQLQRFNPKANFDRDGRAKTSPVTWLFTLGGAEGKTKLFRALAVIFGKKKSTSAAAPPEERELSTRGSTTVDAKEVS